MRMQFFPIVLIGLVGIGGCASTASQQTATDLMRQQAIPPQFYAPQPIAHGKEFNANHHASSWWQQFDDPLVAQLVALAQQHSPSLALAQARIEQARASVSGARAARWPNLSANGKAQRGNAQGPITSNASLSVDASWELDLFGANRSSQAAASARLQSVEAQERLAQVAVAAEIVLSLVSYRHCRATLSLLQEDLSSRQQTWQLTQLKIQAGFTPPADAALLQAALADMRQRVVAQEADCEMEIKAMVALSGLGESQLRDKLALASPPLPQPALISTQQIPAQALAQRPDIASAERDLLASVYEVDVAQAARLPKLNLLGSIGGTALSLGGQDSSASSWSFGPMLSLPIFNAGALNAQVSAAKARQQEALQNYRQQVINAVREIEEALLRLDASGKRLQDASLAAENYGKFFKASSAQYEAGSGSLLDLEEARRNWLAARQNQLAVQRERIVAWIALYKANGGAWQNPSAQTVAQKTCC